LSSSDSSDWKRRDSDEHAAKNKARTVCEDFSSSDDADRPHAAIVRADLASLERTVIKRASFILVLDTNSL
jgi:hypothetical protein